MQDPEKEERQQEPLIESRTQQPGGCAGTCVTKLGAVLLVLAIPLAPVLCAVVAAWLPGSLSVQALWAIALGVPALCLLLSIWPVPVYDPDPYDKVGLFQFTIRGATMTIQNYWNPLVAFLTAASSADWRRAYGAWFERFTTDDKMVGVGFGANSKMFYSYAACKEKLQQMGPKIATGVLQRESQLALGFFNNVSWPEVGRMGLGTSNEDHAFVRPYLAQMFDGANPSRRRWTPASVRSEFKSLFAAITTLDHNNGNAHRGIWEPTFPSASKNIVSQWTVKILHKIALDMDLTDSEAQEMAALQTLSLVAAGGTTRVVSGFLVWAMFTKPTLVGRRRFMEKYRPAIRKRWPDEEWTDKKLDLLSSVLLDAMLFAGGRSVPLAIDLVMGYMLTRNKPAGIVGVDFREEENIRSLLMESMRMHPVVTTLPYWVKSAGPDPAWEHEAPCIDRALADPAQFKDPDSFILNRPGQGSRDDSAGSNSIAWAEFACVDGDNAHPDSHCCPGKQLSINMVVAFVQEYHAAGPWKVANDNITMTYYGSSGFKCTKVA